MRATAWFLTLAMACAQVRPAYGMQDRDEALREMVSDGHEAFERGDYARAVARWRQAYESLPNKASSKAKRQMLLELLLRAYYELDTRSSDLVRVRTVLQLVEAYRAGLGEEESESDTIRDWSIVFKEREARLESEAQVKLLMTANQSKGTLPASDAKPAECKETLAKIGPVPQSRQIEMEREFVRAQRTLTISGATLLAGGIAATGLMVTGLLLSYKYQKGDADKNFEKGYRANGLAIAGAIPMVMLVPGVVLLSKGLRLRTKERELFRAAVTPAGIEFSGHF